MSVALAAVLIIGGFICATLFIAGVPVVFGMMVYDSVKTRDQKAVAVEDASTRIAVERGVARAFVLAGGAFWSIAAFAGLYSFRSNGIADALVAALIPLTACAVTLIVGWYYERFTALLLAAAAVAVVAWGVIYQFELGVWMIMTFALLGPVMTASVLFWLARRDQEAFERRWEVRPQLAPIFAARSTLAN